MFLYIYLKFTYLFYNIDSRLDTGIRSVIILSDFMTTFRTTAFNYTKHFSSKLCFKKCCGTRVCSSKKYMFLKSKFKIIF